MGVNHESSVAHGDARILKNGWIRIRTRNGRYAIPFPLICVECLRPTRNRVRVLFGRTGYVDVGICPQCEQKISRRRTRLLAMLMIPIAVLSVFSGMAVDRSIVHWSFFGIEACLSIFGIGCVAAVLVAGRFANVFQCSLLPRFSAVIRFNNPAFTAIYLGLADERMSSLSPRPRSDT